MKVTAKRTSDTHADFQIVMDKEDLKVATTKAIERLSKDVKVEGFRKGKAPLSLAAPQLDANKITETALDIAIRSNVPAIFEQAKMTPIEIPHFEVTKYVPTETLEFKASLDVFPEIKLGDYKKLSVKQNEEPVTAKDVNKVLDNISKSMADKKVASRAAKEGDGVIIDFTGTKDGKPFDGGSAKDFHLTLGSHQFIDGFEEGIVGHSVGDRFDLNLTFPKDYHVKDLANAKVVFSVLLKQVNEITPKSIDDDLAKACGAFETLKELKADIKKNLQAQNKQKAQNKYKDDLVEALVKKSKVSAPEVMIKDQMQLIRSDFERNAAAHGVSFAELIRSGGDTEESWEKKVHELAEKRVKSSLVLQTLAMEQKIAVDKEAVAAKITELKAVYKKDKNAVKQLDNSRVRDDIANRILIEKTLDFLVDAQK